MSVFEVDDAGDLVREVGLGFQRLGGLDAISQDLRTYLRLRRGEVPTRVDLGLPWTDMLKAGVDTALLGQVVGEEGVLSRPGVIAQDTEVVFAGPSREVTITYQAVASLDDQRRSAQLVGQTSIIV